MLLGRLGSHLRGEVMGKNSKMGLSAKFITVILLANLLVFSTIVIGSTIISSELISSQADEFIAQLKVEQVEEERLLNESLNGKGDLLAKFLVLSAGEMMMNYEHEMLVSLAENVVQDREVNFITFFDSEGTPLNPDQLNTKDSHIIKRDIQPFGDVIGSVVIGMDKSNITGAIVAVSGRIDSLTSRTEVNKGRLSEVMIERSVLFAAISLVLLSLLIYFLFSKIVIKPLQNNMVLAEAIQNGDLSLQLSDRQSKDEMGALAYVMNQMISSLRRIVTEIKASTEGIENNAEALNTFSMKIKKGSELQNEEVEMVTSAVEKLDQIINEVNEKVDVMSRSLDASSTSAQQITSSITNASRLACDMSVETDKISSSIIEMNASLGQTAVSLDSFSSSTQSVARDAEELSKSSQDVGDHAKVSTELAEKVTTLVEEQGGAAIAAMNEVAEKNQVLVEDYTRLINSLGSRSANIGEILEVIRKVAEETSLLSLNAAIIAAQAGEHGKGFAVVATEIGTLAETANYRVREIDDVIRIVQEEVEEAVKLIADVKKGTDQSKEAATNVDKILKNIVDDSSRAAEMAKQIANSADGQHVRSQDIFKVASRNVQEVTEIKIAIDEQKRGSDQIVVSVEELSTIAEEIQSIVQEQAQSSEVISDTLVENLNFSKEIVQAMHEERQASQEIIVSLNQIQKVTGENLDDMENLRSMVGRLRDLSNKLLPEVDRFKLTEQNDSKVELEKSNDSIIPQLDEKFSISEKKKMKTSLPNQGQVEAAVDVIH